MNMLLILSTLALLGILYGFIYVIWEPRFDTIWLNGKHTLIMWYNDYRLYDFSRRSYIVIWP